MQPSTTRGREPTCLSVPTVLDRVSISVNTHRATDAPFGLIPRRSANLCVHQFAGVSVRLIPEELVHFQQLSPVLPACRASTRTSLGLVLRTFQGCADDKSSRWITAYNCAPVNLAVMGRLGGLFQETKAV